LDDAKSPPDGDEDDVDVVVGDDEVPSADEQASRSFLRSFC
jgi:hypothetical protein